MSFKTKFHVIFQVLQVPFLNSRCLWLPCLWIGGRKLRSEVWQRVLGCLKNKSFEYYCNNLWKREEKYNDVLQKRSYYELMSWRKLRFPPMRDNIENWRITKEYDEKQILIFFFNHNCKIQITKQNSEISWQYSPNKIFLKPKRTWEANIFLALLQFPSKIYLRCHRKMQKVGKSVWSESLLG